MVSNNLNPGSKVLKVKPAEKYIIMVLCSAGREDTLLPLAFLTRCLPERPEAAEKGLAEEQREEYTVSSPPSPSQHIPNQSAGGAMLVKKPQPFECLLYLQMEACWNQRHYHMT